jgi:hypothetical protein
VKRGGCPYDCAIHISVAKVLFFVHAIAVKAENPGFDVAPWDQANDRLIIPPGAYADLLQRGFELMIPSNYFFGVSIDDHD